jgi:hypothetical protein
VKRRESKLTSINKHPNPSKHHKHTTTIAAPFSRRWSRLNYTTVLPDSPHITRSTTHTTSCLHGSKSSSRLPARPPLPTKTWSHILRQLQWCQQRPARSRRIHPKGAPRSVAYSVLRKHRSKRLWTIYNSRVRRCKGASERSRGTRLTLESVTERARKLRAQYALQAQGLRTRLEMRVNRIPQALRKRNIQDLLDEYANNAKPKPAAPLAIMDSRQNAVVPSATRKSLKRTR